MYLFAGVCLAVALLGLPCLTFKMGWKIGSSIVASILTDAARQAGADPVKFLAAVEDTYGNKAKIRACVSSFNKAQTSK